MYGKVFNSTFTGSMFGSGAESFAVWTYALSNTNGDHRVELNPQVLAAAIGMELKAVEDIIQKFCSPDPRSRSKKNEGRKLLHEGGFIYFVVNHEDYLKMQNEESRREYWRTAQQASRQRRKQETPHPPHQDAHIPTVEEVVQYGGMHGCSEKLCRDFHTKNTAKGEWVNRYGKLINWQYALETWRENEKMRAFTKQGSVGNGELSEEQKSKLAPHMERIGRAYGRTTQTWDSTELKLLFEISKSPAFDTDLTKVLYMIDDKKDFTTQNVLMLLQRWGENADKARTYKRKL